MVRRIACWPLALLLLAPAAAGGLEIGGATLPDELELADRTLILNGAGLRTKVFFKIYAGGLYLLEPVSDPEGVIAADAPMAVRMHFLYRSVSPEKLVEAFNEGFEHATGGDPGELRDEIEAFNALFNVAAEEGDVYQVAYLPGSGVQVSYNGEIQGVVECGLDFKQAVFAIWLGDRPADKGLKKGMLGS